MSNAPISAAIAPVLQVRDEEVFLGEEILFVAGVRAAVRVEARALCNEPGELRITAPDGGVIVRPHEARSYDGPSQRVSLLHRRCLGDLVPAVTVGDYDLRYLAAGREARARIRVRPSPRSPPVLALEVPDPIDLVPRRPFAVSVALVNVSDAPLRILPPDLCHGASIVGYVVSDDPPLWSRLDRRLDPVEERGPFAHVAPEDVDESAFVTLAPGARHVSAVRFDGVFRDSLDAVWLPRERFTMSLGLVVYARVTGASRPLRWLARARVDYGMDGALRGLGAPRPADGAWERITPTGWPSA